ncbi:MAG TPA: DUF4388 domain-containing protein [Pyrinomonadaceae bacterium]|jgi:hypothetical protein|nr:DUF4388 domain-containing protein [Pyrinomonadaceae bacterium]
MALTGQLSDMSLAELIEFFCNQRKTGRLKIDYQRGHSVFFIREGELVDAKVGALSGVDAVYFSLTLPNAAFDFSPDVQASRRTIDEKWTQVVLEGLRRLDEGIAPTEKDAFGGWSPTDADLAQMLDQVEHLDASAKPKNNSSKNGSNAKNNGAKSAPVKSDNSDADEGSSSSSAAPSAEPFSMMMESANSGGRSRKKLALVAVAAAVLLACAAVAVPFMKRSGASNAAEAVSVAPQPAQPAAPEPVATSTEAAPAENAEAANAEAANADDARRAALERERRERDRRRKEEAAKKDDGADDSAASKPLVPTPAPAGPKSVRVSVSYDEAGRVTQASVAGTTPGAEAYGSTAVRIARGRRFPAGKAGATVVTIPVN